MRELLPLRIGLLGAARIAPMALIRPARKVEDAEVVAVAARDPDRARRFATRFGIPRIHGDYAELISDPELDAIYNPLPNALHCEWTIRALEAGKHVLCEKPMASNAEEAKRMAKAAEASGRELVEAFHWRYHPLATRMREVVRDRLGRLRHVEASMCVPLVIPGDIRFRYDLAGGAAMDVGCYTVSLVRWLVGAEPEVLRAEVRRSSRDVDRWMRAELAFPDGCSGRITCSLFSSSLLRIEARATGSEGAMHVRNPVLPQLHHRLWWRTESGTRVERLAGDSTYTHQLRAFAAHVRGGPRMSSDAHDAVANMRVIDALYDAAGMRRRGH